MTILAVIPVVVPLAVAAAVIAGVFAIFRRRKPAAVDPGQIASAPFLHMEAGTTTAHLERKGNLWQWSLSGSSMTAGSDADAGKAAVAMAAALVESEEGAPIHGSAGGPDVTTHEFGVQPDESDAWDWTITTASKLPAIGNKPAPPTMVASGYEDTQGGATIRMLAKLSAVIPWLNVVDPGGKVGTAEPPKQLPGLIISGNTVAVTDLPTWIAYAAPKVRAWINEGATADEVMDAIVADLPEDAKLSGKTIQDVRERVTELLGMLSAGTYVTVAAPDEQLAAFIVGAQLRDPSARAMEYKDHVILMRTAPGGALGTHWRWDIWEGGVRGYDDAAVKSGSLGYDKTRSQNERAAKQLIDQKINAGGVWPGGGEGGGENFDAAAPKPAVFQSPGPSSSEGYLPPVKHISFGPTMWTKPNQHDVEIFDFKGKAFHSFKHWRIVIGVCLRPTDSKFPFGVLSSILDTDPGQASKVKMVNAHAQGGAIGPPPAIDWARFTKPLLWKAQFDGMVHAGPVIKVDPFADITGTGAGEQVDPCEDDEEHWPVPTNAELGFYVQPVGSIDFLQWHPIPEVTLITKGTKVLARIRYRGFPVFVMGKGLAQAQSGATTKFTADVKIWAAGTNEDV